MDGLFKDLQRIVFFGLNFDLKGFNDA